MLVLMAFYKKRCCEVLCHWTGSCILNGDGTNWFCFSEDLLHWQKERGAAMQDTRFSFMFCLHLCGVKGVYYF